MLMASLFTFTDVSIWRFGGINALLDQEWAKFAIAQGEQGPDLLVRKWEELANHLMLQNTALLSVPMPDDGRGYVFNEYVYIQISQETQKAQEVKQ